MRSVDKTEVSQDSPIRTEEIRLIRCLLYGKQEQFNSFNVTGLSVTDFLLANGDELNIILPKLARPLYFFFYLIRLFGTSINKYC